MENDRMTITNPNRKELIATTAPPGFQLCANRCAGKVAHREGYHHAAGVLAEDFGGAGDISTDAKADITLTR